VKLQTYTADTLTIDCDDEHFRIQGTLWDGRTLYDLYREAATPWEWFPRLQAAAKELGLVEQTLRNWVNAAAAGTLNGVGAKVVTPEQMELSRLRAENVRLKRENEILKNGPHGLPCPLCIET
jgi:hypothetical protein